MARPVDPRLWRYARSARRYLVVSVGLSLVTTACIVVAALALARVLAGVITDPGRRSVGAWVGELVVFAAAVGCRAAATWWQARLAHRAGAEVVAELERSVLGAAAKLPPRELDSRRTELAVVVGSGLSGLRAYLTGYLPALLLAVLVPPIVLGVIAFHDLTAGAIILVTLPLIPVFMVLIGLMTQGRAAATLAATTRLSDQLLDLFAGMPTLRALGREGAGLGSRRSQRDRVRALGESLHDRTMSALRVAFLSSMVLELLATLCVALVAVSIGMRLVFGHMSLYAGLLGLILAPEVYLPLRAVGERFHAAQDGMAAATKAFAVLEPAGVDRIAPGGDVVRGESVVSGAALVGGGSVAGGAGVARGGGLAFDGAVARGEAARGGGERRGDRAVHGGGEMRGGGTVRGGGKMRGGGDLEGFRGVVEVRGLAVYGRDGGAPDGFSAVLRPGRVTVLTGPNGCGKSTVLQAVLGLLEPDRGVVTVDGVAVPELDADRWWGRVAWLPQRPVLLPGTLRENLELFGARVEEPAAGPVRVLGDLEAACAATGFDAVLDELPERWDTLVGTGGLGLSLGQRQRLALTRVLASDRPVLLLDEPTAHLDDAAEATVLAALTARARAGATVVVVAHRPTVLAAADEVVEVGGATYRSAVVALPGVVDAIDSEPPNNRTGLVHDAREELVPDARDGLVHVARDGSAGAGRAGGVWR
ncbi:ABC transporter ATP-binding protein/permease [Nocardia blacklockiae]|uniref:ABC transporter ATP-binding protein/permease n=1 Tax=Nocardia blacklockiae TaxID=480036 RepID=UPI001894492C|nr:ATP-binding cassette domain-containing protein [Nocardia blacklockiae]MBF6171700.1 ATP-binding cassette domain-containing protein [Nocardia blacklockiae]